MRTYDFDKKIDRRGTYCTQWDFIEDRFGDKELLPFSISDTDFEVPEEVTKALQKRMEHQVFGYTRWNHTDYKAAIQNWYHRHFQVELKGDWILYSPSVIYSVARLIELHSEEGDGVLIQTPAYDAFFKTISASGRSLIENPLRYQDGGYELDFEDLEEKIALPETRVFLLCSPHNPTGRVWTYEEIKKIVQLCKQHNVFLISDEIHMDVRRPGKQHYPVLLFEQDYDRMALCSSASKTFNTPGLGGSYLLLPNENIRDDFTVLLKNRDGLSSASIFGIVSLMAAYEEGSEWLKQLNLYIDENFYHIKEFFQKEYPEVQFTVPESTYLAWIDISGLPYSMEDLQEALVKVGRVAIMNGEIYGGNGKQFLRLNAGCSREKLKAGLERFKKAVESLKK